MSIREWIRELEIGGTPTFSFSSVRRFFPNIAEQSIKNDLFRLSTQKIIVPVYRGFYVIMPLCLSDPADVCVPQTEHEGTAQASG